MATREAGRDKHQPRRDEERDRWREGGYRGHAAEAFGPEAQEGADYQDSGFRKEPHHAAETAAPQRPDGRPVSRPRPARQAERPADYTGFSEPGGGVRAAPHAAPAPDQPVPDQPKARRSRAMPPIQRS